MPRGGNEQPGLYDQFGSSCPVCGLPLGSPVAWDSRSGRFQAPPCFRLELGPSDDVANYPWRVSVVGANFPPAYSQMPFFVESEVEYVYVLCGDGHIFPQSAPVNARDRLADARARVDRWNMVAAVGAPASGKTYLLIRMLGQHMENPLTIFPRPDQVRIHRHHLSPLEQVPLDRRSGEYTRTIMASRAIEPTLSEETRPAIILEDMLPDAVDAIRHIIRKTVVDGERRAEQWGKGFRQPLVVRTSSDAMLTWTGIADLPGELFAPGPGKVRERNRLRAYDGLIWVIDPVVAEAALDPLTKESLSETSDYISVLDGSLRPGTIASQDPTRVRADRELTQQNIGESLTLIGNDYAINQGRALEMLIVINKCDLIHAALRKNKKLVELGRRDSVRQGVAGYLASITQRWAQQRVMTDPEAERLLRYLHGARSAQQSVHQQRVFQVTDGLLRHYSHERAFWGLVHEGSHEEVNIAGNGSMEVSSLRIEVSSIGEHVDRSTLKGSAERLLIRDLVMSALGCGLASGLGHQNAVHNLLRNEWQRIRLFLCSPLATVPVGRATADPSGALLPRLEPLEPRDQFPAMRDGSAALTQLLLAALRKARS